MSSNHEGNLVDQQPQVFWPSSLARRWDISIQTLWRWRREHRVPEPDVHIAGNHGWSAEVVAKIERGELPKVAA